MSREKLASEIINELESDYVTVGFDEPDELFRAGDEERQVKTITLKTNEYIFDVNSLFLPFMPEYRGEKVQIIEVEQINSAGSNKIEVRGDSELGVPTVYDKMTLTALQKIFIKQRSYNGKINFKTKNITEEDRIIKPITITELAREMGYKGNISVAVKASICDSIRRLSFTTYVSSNDRTYNHKDKEYLMKAEEGIHLLKYKMLTLTDIEKEIRRKQSSYKKGKAENKKIYLEQKERVFEGSVQIVLDDVVYRAMACEQILYYKDTPLSKIKHPYSKSIYMLALKMAGSSKEWKVSYKKLLTYFPPKPEMTYRRAKEIVNKALDRISESGVCRISYLKNDVVSFTFKDKENQNTKTGYDYMTDRFNTFGEMLQGYLDLGLTQEEVFGFNMQKQRYYEALVRYATLRKHYGSIKDTREFVLKYIKNEYPIDDKYYTK